MQGFNRASQKLNHSLMSVLSNFRLSLTFRIAMHYCWQLMRTTMLTMLVVTLFYGAIQAGLIMNEVDWLSETPLAAGQEAFRLKEHVQAVLLASGMDGAAADFWLDGTAFDVGLSPLSLTVTAPHASGGILVVEFDLSPCTLTWSWLMMALLLCDTLRMISFLRHRQRLDKSVLAPIRDITDMAATLSASNLSNRINIAGTKNELKDLATVINTMLDRIERSYNSQKQFVSDASHELRTPIAVIQGYVRMLQRWGKDDPGVLEEGISAIAQETASMKELVESLLFLARHDKKTLLMEMETFDPCVLISELHKEAAMVTPENQFILSPADHCSIEGDRGMIKQVMRILLDNAVKYTPKGGVITMGVRRDARGCTLTMQDNGPGIPKEELPKIFDRFYRSDSARKAESGGHGLGLSIARIIVIAHGGKLSVRSKVGAGTTFSVTLPEKQSRLHTAQLKNPAAKA